MVMQATTKADEKTKPEIRRPTQERASSGMRYLERGGGAVAGSRPF